LREWGRRSVVWGEEVDINWGEEEIKKEAYIF